MKRNGKDLPTLRDGHPRRLSDARNAWRKANDEQRIAIVAFILENDGAELMKAALAEKAGL